MALNLLPSFSVPRLGLKGDFAEVWSIKADEVSLNLIAQACEKARQGGGESR